MLPAIHKHVVRRLDCGLRADPRSASLHTGACTHSEVEMEEEEGGKGEWSGSRVRFRVRFDSTSSLLATGAACVHKARATRHACVRLA